LHIHYLGKIEVSAAGVSIRATACRDGEERSHFISMMTTDVTCPRCRAHGLFAHGQARDAGKIPTTSKRYLDEYDRITSPSTVEVERLSYYRKCHTIKFLSMIDLYLDGDVESYWLERTPDEWQAVAALYMAGSAKEALSRVRALNRKKPPAPRPEDIHRTTTSIEAVNVHRRNAYRIHEFKSDRLIPHQSELYELMRRYPDVTNLDEAITKLAMPETDGTEVQLVALTSETAFELASIVAEGMTGGGREDWFLKALAAAGTPLPQSLADTLAKKMSQAAPSVSRTIVIELGKPSMLDSSDADIEKMVREFFKLYSWMDPTVITVACQAAKLSALGSKRLMNLARDLEPDKAQTLRRLASLYKMPRGVIMKDGNEFRLVPYRELFGMIGKDSLQSQLLTFEV
jgi:hypothetical protein